MRRRSRLVLTCALVPVAAVLAACTGPDRPPASDAATALAAALQEGDLSGVELVVSTSSDPQTQLTEVLEPLVETTGERERAVRVAEVGDVVEGEDGTVTASATLAWSWQLTDAARWEYTTTADLAFAEPSEGSDSPGRWQVVWEPDLLVPDLAGGERLDVDRLRAERAEILDGAGEPLVTERAVWRIGIDKMHTEPEVLEPAARAVAELVGRDADEFVAQVQAAGEKAFVEAITIRQENPGTHFTVEDAREIRGVAVIPSTMILAPTSTFAAPILGRAGEATAEIVEESEGRVRAGDITGLSGLQRQYDEQLAGVDGIAVNVVPAEAAAEGEPGEDDVVRVAFSVEPVHGTPLSTTFDVALQGHAEEVLSDVGPASAIVAVRPSTGEVLAAASGPGGEGWSTATLGQYPPGSTFKIVDALAMLRAGLTPDSTVECTSTLTVDGRTYRNVPGYPSSALGQVPLSTAFAHSCNTAMIAQRDVVDQGAIAAAAADLGLGVPSAVGAPAFLGEVPTEASGTAHAEAMIGQGEVLASPLAMATVAASVAAGERVQPVLVRPDGAFAATPEEGADDAASAAAGTSAPSDVAPSGLTADEAATLRDLMRGVVTEGSASALADVPGIVGAKTGTAQYGDGSRQHAWMVAIVDDLAVAVFVEDGELGSTTAGPLLGEFLAAL
ncbi:penicillin-binding transpeptidase domain-containing protein [Isoptericola variabilis]|uniref:penicillin-binding transpeptidase domain-containing protein n=1 Tax=Isoptericola variabilis TaxID=139208 RepID=UPI00059D50D9|nr:penicillin-binding transpeptidase domain-containing protein [Isoptericola variabilis]